MSFGVSRVFDKAKIICSRPVPQSAWKRGALVGGSLLASVGGGVLLVGGGFKLSSWISQKEEKARRLEWEKIVPRRWLQLNDARQRVESCRADRNYIATGTMLTLSFVAISLYGVRKNYRQLNGNMCEYIGSGMKMCLWSIGAMGSLCLTTEMVPEFKFYYTQLLEAEKKFQEEQRFYDAEDTSTPASEKKTMSEWISEENEKRLIY